MTRAFVPFAVLSASLLSLSARGNIRDSSPVVPLSWAVEVYRTYCPELMAEAHIEDCWTGYMNEGLHLVVVTDTPALVPSEIDTTPVLTEAPPPAESGQGSTGPPTPSTPPEPAPTGEPQHPPIAGIPYATAQEIFSRQPFDTLAGV